MIWVKRILLLLIGSIVAVSLLLAIIVVTFDESDYKHSLAWIAERFFDSKLRIDGALSLRISRQLDFSANNISLQAKNDSYQFTSKALSLDIQLVHLLSGTLWLNDISVSGLYLRVNETQTHTLDWSDIQLPSVIVERASFDQLVIEYQELPPGTLHHIALDSLQLDDVNDSGPVSLQARGVFEDEQFTLSGSLPAIADVLARDKPMPLQLDLASKNNHLTVSGSITDPAKGEGMNLQLDVRVLDTRSILEWLGDDVPDFGALNMTARLLGSYESPRLEDISATLKDGDTVEMTASGFIDDIYRAESLDIIIESHSPRLASWFLSGKPDRYASVELKARVHKLYGKIMLSDLVAKATAHTGLSFKAKGSTEIYPEGHVFSQSDAGLNVSFTAPSLSALTALDFGSFPALGTLSGHLRLSASMDTLGVFDADAKIARTGIDSVHLQGKVASIPILDATHSAGIDLQVAVDTTSAKDFAARLGYTIPDVGSGEARMKVTGSLDKLQLQQVRLQAGDPSGLQLTAIGRIDQLIPGEVLQKTRAQFKVTARAPSLGDFSAMAGVGLPALGAVDIQGKLSLQQGTLRLQDTGINIGRPDQPTIRLQGTLVTQLHKGSTIDVTYNVAVADLVAAYNEKVPGYLGRLQGEAEISDIDGSWGIETFKLLSTQTNLYKVDIHGGFDDLKNSDGVNISIDIDVDDPADLGKALGIRLVGLGAYRKQGRFTSSNDVISYHGSMTVGGTHGTTVIHGVKHGDHPAFRGSLSIPLLDLADFGFNSGSDIEDDIIAAPQSGGKDYLFSRRPLHVDFLNEFDLDLKINIDEVESYGESSIDSVSGHVLLQNGDLRIDPLSFVYAGGVLDIKFGLLAQQPPSLSLRVKADDLLLGPAMAQVKSGEPIRGRTNVKMDITAEGDTAHAMASDLNGVINVEYENARIPSKLIEYLSVDLFGWVFSTADQKKKYITLNCVVAEFTAVDGELNSKLLVADGANLSVGGRVDLDLRNETIDAVFLPKQKKRLFSSITPVKLSGPIKSPNVEAIPVKAAIQQLGILALSPTLYLSVSLIEKIWGAIKSGSDVGEGCIGVEKLTDIAEAEAAKKSKQSVPDPYRSDLLSD